MRRTNRTHDDGVPDLKTLHEAFTGISEQIESFLREVLARDVALESGDAIESEMADAMTDDKSDTVRDTRRRFFASEDGLPQSDRMLVLNVTNHFERVAAGLGRCWKKARNHPPARSA